MHGHAYYTIPCQNSISQYLHQKLFTPLYRICSWHPLRAELLQLLLSKLETLSLTSHKDNEAAGEVFIAFFQYFSLLFAKPYVPTLYLIRWDCYSLQSSQSRHWIYRSICRHRQVFLVSIRRDYKVLQWFKSFTELSKWRT